MPPEFRFDPAATPPRPDLAPRDAAHYVFLDARLPIAVNAALATGRCLLVKGAPGSGKSTLARHVAWKMGWRFYEEVVTSRTSARDLLWRMDTVRRLGDAQLGKAGEVRPALEYVEPGVLWWAMSRESADAHREASQRLGHVRDPGEVYGDGALSVVLLDEIDKADPDVPNDLLQALGAGRFQVTDRPDAVEAKNPYLLVLTTNDERELPPAFLRRCVVTEIAEPSASDLAAIAGRHDARWSAGLRRALARRTVELREAYRARGERRPGIAEYLDAVRACHDLRIGPSTRQGRLLLEVTLAKEREKAEPSP